LTPAPIVANFFKRQISQASNEASYFRTVSEIQKKHIFPYVQQLKSSRCVQDKSNAYYVTSIQRKELRVLRTIASFGCTAFINHAYSRSYCSVSLRTSMQSFQWAGTTDPGYIQNI